MNKIWLIIKREYLVRVRKRSFIVMTILGPILMASLIILPTYLTIQGKEERIIALNEKGDFFSSRIGDTGNLHFVKIPEYSRRFGPIWRNSGIFLSNFVFFYQIC